MEKKRFFVVLKNSETQKKEIREIRFTSFLVNLYDFNESIRIGEPNDIEFGTVFVKGELAGGIPVVSQHSNLDQKLLYFECWTNKITYERFDLSDIYTSIEAAKIGIKGKPNMIGLCKRITKRDHHLNFTHFCNDAENWEEEIIEGLPNKCKLLHRNHKSDKRLNVFTYKWDGGQVVKAPVVTKYSEFEKTYAYFGEIDRETKHLLDKDKNILIFDIADKSNYISTEFLRDGYETEIECLNENSISIYTF